MKTTVHKAGTRGHANHGWLDSHHTFSFANYYDPTRIQFGALRVLNDDSVAGGMGFGTHPHDNMEIISIPLQGDLEHKDSMGTSAVIRQNDVQIMSAGTGIRHSEYNKNKDSKVNFLQIWVLPKKRNITPRYEQKAFAPEQRVNTLQEVVSANEGGDGVWINQDAWFYLGNLRTGFATEYKLKDSSHGVYVFVLEGDVTVGDQKLSRRDGIQISGTDSFTIASGGESEILVMEVPL